MSTTFTHPKPTMPPVVRWLTQQHRQFDRALSRPGVHGLAEATRVLMDMVATKLTPGEREQVAAYNRQVDTYNAAVRAHRAQVATAQQTRRNAAEVAEVRSAACSVCTTTHPGEC